MPRAEEADELLVARAQQGDAAAFGSLAQRYQDTLFNSVYRMVGHRGDAEDLTQEALVKAFHGIGAFRGQSSFYTWLYAIAYNTVVNHRRKTGGAHHLNPLSLQDSHGDDGQGHEVEDKAERPDAAAERGELLRRVEEAIASLQDDQRAVVVMRDVEGFDYREIAELLGCAQGTVKSRLHRARQALREMLGDLLE